MLFHPAIIRDAIKLDNESISEKQLRRVLNNDIHSKPIGCKIADTHIRIGPVHLDTFYEAQFLFGNAYWSDVFALYLSKHILKKLQEKKFKNIILYGYETYSSIVIDKLNNFLPYAINDQNKSLKENIININNIYKIYYENPLELVSNTNIRYLNSCKKEIESESTLVIYIVGISSTLSTFNKMNEAIRSAIVPRKIGCDELCISIIQSVPLNYPNDIIKICKIQKTAENITKENQFINNKKISFYLSIEANWYPAENCELCFPTNLLKERPLIEVDHTSVVPAQLIKPNFKIEKNRILSDIDKAQERAEVFLSKEKARLEQNATNPIIYYNHIERDDNHYRYYIRHSKILLEEREEIEKWLAKIKKDCFESIDNQVKSNRQLNIIVAPVHFSNTGFISLINYAIFEGRAYHIVVDSKKTFRSEFVAKYSNYSELNELLESVTDCTINFYFADDQIITGKTFYRIKSLLNSLINQNTLDNQNRNHINLFNGVFVLSNRSSFGTLKNYMSLKPTKDGNYFLPYYCFYSFEIPNFRSHYDACPICKSIIHEEKILDHSSLNETAFYFQEKIIYHRKKNLSEVRKTITEYSQDRVKRNFRRFYCENKIWNIVKQHNENIDTIETLEEKIVSMFSSNTKNIVEEIEMLISYIKVMSRPLIFYQENVKKCVFKILLSIFSKFIMPDMKTKEMYENLYVNISKNASKLHPNLIFDLYRILMARLCSVGSNILLNKKCLESAIVVGKELCEESGNNVNDYYTFILYSIKKLLYNDSGYYKSERLDTILKEIFVFDNILSNTSSCDDISLLYIKLYLENNKLLDKEKLGPNLFEEKLDIKDKYSALAKTIKSEIKNCEVGIYAFSNNSFLEKRESQYKLIGFSKEIFKEERNFDSSFSIEGNTIYINIGNNYRLILEAKQKKQFGYIDDDLLAKYSLNKNISCVVMIKLENFPTMANLEILRKILFWRKIILDNVEQDLNNDDIPQLILGRKINEALTDRKAVTHSENPFDNFAIIIKNIEQCEKSIEVNPNTLPSLADIKDTKYKILDELMNLTISRAYQAKMRESLKNYLGITDEMFFYRTMTFVSPPDLEFTEDDIDKCKIAFSQIYEDRNITIKYDIPTFPPNKYLMPMQLYKSFDFRYSLFMLIKLFIDNALNHNGKNIEISIIKSENETKQDNPNFYKANGIEMYDLIVKNEFDQEKISKRNGITHEALEYIFQENFTKAKSPHQKNKSRSYEIRLKQCIKLKNKGGTS